MTYTTASTSTTLLMSWPCDGDFDRGGPCEWREMHHTDEEGRHWCPTGFLYCQTHGGVGEISGPGTCQLWGEWPDENDLSDEEVRKMWDEADPA